LGTHVPLAVRWPGRVKAGCVVEDFVSLTDLAPTFLEIGGLLPTADMTGKSLLNILTSSKSGRVERKRDKVFTGKERHAWVRWGGLGYPQRAIRTYDYLYIRNFEPGRWPAGDPKDRRIYKGGYGDIDAAPAKSYMLEHRDNPEVQRLFKLAFEKRPGEELYDLKKDPQQLNNVAYDPAYAEAKGKLAAALMAELTAKKDPRVLGSGEIFDKYPYYGRVGKLKPPLLPGKVR
jgi:N-sulfoglucosamine sulfohydrolase